MRANAGDTVDLGAVWSIAPPETINSETFRVFTVGAATLKISQAATIISPVLDLSSLDGNIGFAIDAGAAGSSFGQAISPAGDVNGDGYEDIIIGDWLADSGDTEGKAYVVFGKASGFPSEFDVDSFDGSNGFKLDPIADPRGRFGWAVSAAGDVNGDGFADLLTSSYGHAAGGKRDSGETYVIFGKATGFPAALNVATLDGTTGFRLRGASQEDASGFQLSDAGDVNGDGYGDILIEAVGATNDEYDGEVYVVFGKPSGFDADIDLASLDGENGFTIEGERIVGTNGHRLGNTLHSAGDFNGDGFADLILGSSDRANNFTGKAYVVFGGAQDFPARLDVQNLDGANGFALLGTDELDFFGRNVSGAGDVNSDGFDDLIVSANGADPGGRAEAGEVYVIFGTAAAMPATLAVSTLDGSNGFVVNGIAAGDEIGRVYAGGVNGAGDVNADGYDDFVIGSTIVDPDGSANAGQTYLIFGRPIFPAGIELLAIDSDSGLAFNGIAPGDFAGKIDAAGDMNGDGFDDFLIGASGVSPRGKAYVIFGTNLTNSATHISGGASDTLTGNASANVMIGGQGNDLLIGNGGADVLRGGQGDDVLAISDLNFKRIDGGTGDDTLRLDGTGITLDLRSVADNRLEQIERIDITGTGNNTLRLTHREVLNLSETSNTLIVRGDVGDTIDLFGVWNLGSTEVINSETFVIYTLRAATVKVSQAATVSGPIFELSSLLASGGGDGTQGFVVKGDATSVTFGLWVDSAGDLNGDGFDDMLMASRGAEPGGKTGAGQAYVVFGKADGFPAELSVSALNGTNGFRIPGLVALDRLGEGAAAAGDVNGDGFDDLFIGAYRADPGGADDLGQAYVVFGKPTAFPPDFDLTTLDGDNGFTINGRTTDSFLGLGLADAGDVNADGFGDLIVGALGVGSRVGGIHWDGEAYVIFGAASGFPALLDVGSLNGTNGFTMFGRQGTEEGISGGDGIGRAVDGAGDINGDGYADVIIGSSTYKGDGPDFAGQSYVVFGAASGFPAQIDLTQDLTGSNGFQINGIDELDDAGFNGVKGAGDFNGDGFDDLLIGARGAAEFAGAAYIIFGTAAAFPAQLELSSLDGSSGFVLQGIEADDRAAEYIGSAGDVNGDGYDDVLIGARRGDALGDDTGETYLVFGGPGPFSPAFELSLLDGSNGMAFIGTAVDDFAGRSVSSAQDVNGDGFDDFLIDASGFDVNGAVFLVLGTDFTGSATHVGDAADNTLTGDANANTMIGGRGNDLLIGAGGLDVLRGGQGDDVLAVGDANFRRIVGGNGFDTLRIDADNVTLDLTTIPDNRIEGIERIDSTHGELTKVTLSLREVLNISDESNTLLVRAKVSDTITIGTGWTNTGTETIVGEEYTVYTQGAATLKVASLTSIILSNNLIAENTDTTNPVTVGDLKGISGQTTVFILVAGAGDDDNATFELNGNLLQVKAGTVLDFEAKTSYLVRVRLVDGTETFEESFTISVTDVNETPSDITLSASSILENTDTTNPVDVGDLVAVDIDAGDTHVFSLVAGLGSDDNATFQISGNSLQVTSGTMLNHELKGSYTVRVRATDSGGLLIEKPFTITVTDVNDQPTDVVLDNDTVAENTDTSNPVVVGQLAGVDEDPRDSHSFLLVAGNGSTDNGTFQISGSNLEVKAGVLLDHEAQDQYSIRVQGTDPGGLSFEQVLTVFVADVNESPTSLALSASAIGDGADTSTGAVEVGDLTAIGDPDDPTEPFGMHAFSLVPGADDNAEFQLSGRNLQIKQGVSIDRFVKPLYTVRVSATDGDNTIEQSITLNVIPALVPSLSVGSISELDGTAIGTITRQLNIESEVVVLLSSSDTSEATVPVSITIPANEAAGTFSIAAQDDSLLDGVQTVTITAAIEGFRSESITLDVTDFEALVVSITEDAIAENGGTAMATVSRTDSSGSLTVDLLSNDTSEAAVAASIVIPNGQLTSLPFAINAVDDAILDGTQTVEITASATGYVDGSDSLEITDFEQLVLSITEDAISENGGTGTATVSRTDPSGALTVNLLSDDTSEATVVAAVVFANGQLTSLPIPISAVDDAILDGTQTVAITASATDYVDGSDTLEVTDFEQLAVSVADGEISENGGATTATVTRTDPSGSLTVNLMSDDTGEATVVASVNIPAGQLSSVPFPINAVDDAVLDGSQSVTISASAIGYVDGDSVVEVTDFEELVVSIIAAAISEDGGSTTATVTRTDSTGTLTVNLFSDDTSEATVAASIMIPSGQLTSEPFTISAVDDTLLDGTQTVTITASASGYVDGTDGIDVTDHETLLLSIDAASISENGGATTGTVRRSNTDNSQALTVNVTSNDTSEAIVPLTITIPANQGSATFSIAGVDDNLLDGTQTVTITALAAGYVSANDSLDVTDHEALSLIIDVSSISENGGSAIGTVTRSSTDDLSQALTVNLMNDDTTEASVPATVTIASGLAVASFTISAVDDALLDGTQTVTITSSAAGYVSSGRSLDVVDHETLSLVIDEASISENGGSATGTVSRGDTDDLSQALTVSLTNGDDTEVTVPATVTIASGVAAANFTINAVDDALLDGTQTVTITPSAAGYITVSSSLDVTDHETLSLLIDLASISENGGSATGTVTRSNTDDLSQVLTVDLTSDDATEATVPASVTIASGLASVDFTISAVDDALLDGTQTVTMTASATGYDSDSAMLSVTDQESLSLVIDDTVISENGGTTAVTVTRTDASGDLTVQLTSDDTSEATVPAAVNFTDGVASVQVTLTAVDDFINDGSQHVTISASALGYDAGSDTIEITDDDFLQLAIDAAAISENGGSTTIVVSRNNAIGDLPVNLVSDDESEAIVVATVIILEGQTDSAPVAISAVDDTLLDGTQAVTITASASGFFSVTDTILVTDFETVSLMIDVASISESDGSAVATVTRSNTDNGDPLVINVATSDTSEASVPSTVAIGSGSDTATFNITGVDDSLLDGTQTVTIDVTANGYVGASVTIDVTDHELLAVDIVAESISENGGSTTATVTRTDPTGDLTVVLTNSDSTEATTISSIVISDGQLTSAAFIVNAVDDDLLDGTQVVNVTATASGYIDGSDQLDVLDHETLTLSILDASIRENGGSTTATVVRSNVDTALALTITITGSDATEAFVPAQVDIPAGEMSATFTINAVDDQLLDGTQSMTLTATAPGYFADDETLEVTDHESLTLTIAADEISENGGVTTVTVTRSNTDASAPLTVLLESDLPDELSVPQSVIIPANFASTSFTIQAIDDTLLQGTQQVIVTASAGGYNSGTDTVDVTDHETLSLMLDATSLSENGGSILATLTRSNTDVTQPLYSPAMIHPKFLSPRSLSFLADLGPPRSTSRRSMTRCSTERKPPTLRQMRAGTCRVRTRWTCSIARRSRSRLPRTRSRKTGE